MDDLIKFCINANEADFFKYLMLEVALNKQKEQLQNLLEKYSK